MANYRQRRPPNCKPSTMKIQTALQKWELGDMCPSGSQHLSSPDMTYHIKYWTSISMPKFCHCMWTQSHTNQTNHGYQVESFFCRIHHYVVPRNWHHLYYTIGNMQHALASIDISMLMAVKFVPFNLWYWQKSARPSKMLPRLNNWLTCFSWVWKL